MIYKIIVAVGTQRHPVLALRLHARRQDRPHQRDKVDLVPRRQPDLARPRRGQHQELATPRACRPYRAQTKGKVERPIRYIRDSFFYGRAFANDEDLNEQASRWLEGTANVRRHGTTGERPVDRFERDERGALRPLASHPYRRLGVRPAAAPAHRRVPETVAVERRSLRVYAEAAR